MPEAEQPDIVVEQANWGGMYSHSELTGVMAMMDRMMKDERVKVLSRFIICFCLSDFFWTIILIYLYYWTSSQPRYIILAR